MGTTVIGGMLAATCLAIFLIPVTFYVVERIAGRGKKPIYARVDDYATRLDGRSRLVGGGLDDDLGDALATASAELARSIESLSVGYRAYGRALMQLATGYAELERSVMVPRR